MKTLKLFITALVLILAGTLQAQVSVNVRLPAPPPWGPIGYNEVQYYYLPDVEAYYDVPSAMFIYHERGIWVHRSYLPRRYRNYDLYGGYKVVMNGYHGNAPYENFREYQMKYRRGYRGEEQRTIGDRPGRGNQGERMSPGNGRSREINSNNVRGSERGNDRNMREGHGNGGGEERGKRK